MAALQLCGTSRDHQHHHHLVPARRDSSPLLHTLTEPPATVYELAASTPLGRPREIGQSNQTKGLSAGTIAAITLSGLILIFLLTGAYTCASSHHKSRRDRRSTLARRSHYYQDDGDGGDDIEMQAKRHTRRTQLGQVDEDQSTDQQQSHSYHHEGAGMGYDDEDGKEAWIEVGTARVARIRRVPSGSVSIRNIGRSKAAVPLGSSQTVRDVGSLPDLAWAETLTTGGGRRPGIVAAPGPAAAAAARPPPAPATRTSSKSSGSERSKKLQERSESRRAVKRKAIREWCARGSGGGLGPYSAAY